MMNVAVLFGGCSGEHEVSLVSGTTVMSHLDKERYRVFAVGIRRDGSFASAPETAEMLREPLEDVEPVSIRPVASEGSRLVDLVGWLPPGEEVVFDLWFPVLHGPFGEDGTMQGLLEMTARPYVGCGVQVSSAGMDKEMTKRILRESALPVIDWVTVYWDEWDNDRDGCTARIIEGVGTPCFVKPCRMGSSVGVTRAGSVDEIEAAVTLALDYDYKVVVEKALVAREFECAVMGNRDIKATGPGEILPSREFYDYSAKYLDGDGSKLLIPAPVSGELSERMRVLAAEAFQSLGGEGFARVDFLQDERSEELYVNEINTIPGFTEISMFPKLWANEGWEVRQLLDHLVDLGLERFRWKKRLKTAR
jgi:D-alanine-D-alanine ligase